MLLHGCLLATVAFAPAAALLLCLLAWVLGELQVRVMLDGADRVVSRASLALAHPKTSISAPLTGGAAKVFESSIPSPSASAGGRTVGSTSCSWL